MFYRVFQKCLNRTAKITLAACRLLLLRKLSIWWRYPQCRSGINETLCINVNVAVVNFNF